MNDELKYPSRKTISKLTEELKLKGADKHTQDWEYEVANVNQLQEYIDYYKTRQLNLNEKATLMRIILEAYNDYMLDFSEDSYGEIIKVLLEDDYIIHEETIKYWACENDSLDNCFYITPFIRLIRNNV